MSDVQIKKERFISETDLLSLMGSKQLIVIEPRYTTWKFVAAFGSCAGDFADIVDALTSGDSEYARVTPLFDTPWYPIGYGDTIVEAIEAAIDRINTIEPKFKREALALVHNSTSIRWDHQSREKTVPLVLTGEDW